MQLAPEQGQLLRAQGQRRRQVGHGGFGVRHHTSTRAAIEQRPPGVHVHRGHLGMGCHAGVGQRHAVERHAGAPTRVQPDRAAQHPGLRAGEVALIDQRSQRPQPQLQAVTQACTGGGQRRWQQGVLEAQGQRGGGRLAQRGWQVHGHALQAAGDLQFRHPAAHAQRGGVGGGTRHAFCQPGHEPQFTRLAQSIRAQGALGTDGQHRCVRRPCHHRTGSRLHPPFQPGVAPQHAGLHRIQREAFFAEVHRTPGAPQQRCVGRDAHVVAGQHDTATHGGFLDVGNGQAQLELEVGGTGGRGRIQRVGGHAGHGRAVHHAQHLRQRTMHIGGDVDHRVLQVRNGRIGAHHTGLRHPGEAARGLVHPHAGALEDQLAAQLRQGGPGPGTRGQQARRRIVVHHVAQLRRDAELTLSRIAERQVVQVPLDTELGARHGA